MNSPNPVPAPEFTGRGSGALVRDRACIAAVQRRLARNPVRDFLWRRPWRSPTSLVWSVRQAETPKAALTNAWSWIANAHDCGDPSVACSCAGGYRFPRIGETS